jgi:hypothetical protein
MAEGSRPISGLSRTLVVMLVPCGAQGVLGAVLGLVQGIAFPELAGLEEPETGPQTAMMIGVACHALAYLFVYIATFVVFGMFTHRSCHNAHALGARGMEFTPGWAVGWYFIPIMNLFKPYQAVQEIYLALDPHSDADDWRRGWVPGVVLWWWVSWIASNVLGGIAGRMAFSSSPAVHAVAPWLDVADGLLDVVLCTLAVVVVRMLTARQEQKARVTSFA